MPRLMPLRAPIRITPAGRCQLDGSVVEVITHPTRRTEVRCPGCERRRAGLCLDCDARISGRRWRCPVHQRAAKRAYWRVYKSRHVSRAQHAANMRAWYQRHRDQEVLRMRQWRAQRRQAKAA